MHPAQTDTSGSIAGCGGNLNEPADPPPGRSSVPAGPQGNRTRNCSDLLIGGT